MRSTGRCGPIIARALAIIFIVCLAECAAASLRQQGSSGGIKKASGTKKGSCLSYGHSCWGAHGKRGGARSSAEDDRTRPSDGQNLWFLSRYFRLNPDSYRGQFEFNQARKGIQSPSMRDIVSNAVYAAERQKPSPEYDYSEPQAINSNEADPQELSSGPEALLTSNEDENQTDDRIIRRNKLMQTLALSRTLKM